MIKFFRKHNKKLLVVFMVGLMVVFLGGSALTTMLQPDFDRVIGSSRWGDISQADQFMADETTQILSALDLPWQRMFGAQEPLETLDWVLLTKEAQYLGSDTDMERVRLSLVDGSEIENAARLLRKKPVRILRAMAEYSSIQETALAVSAASVPSEAKIRTAAHSTLEKVKINAVMLPATAFLDEESELAEEDLLALFQAHRQREAGQGLEFGYYVKPKIKIQYIKIDRDKIAESIRVVNLDEKAKEYYEERRERDPSFRRPQDETDSQPEEVEGPVPEKPSPYFAWDEAADLARQAVRKRESTDMAARIADWLIRYMNEPWLDRTRGEDLYRAVPEKVARLDYFGLVLGRLPKSLGYPDAVSTVTTDFFHRADADAVPDIGPALFISTRVGSFERLADLAFRTKAIVPKIPSQRGINISDYLSEFQTCRRPLRNSDGNVFLFRVVDAQPAHIPETIDEVRDRVEVDLRLKKAYEEALVHAESLRSCEDTGSLAEAYESDDEFLALKDLEGGRDSGFFEVPPIARVSRYQAEAGIVGTSASVGVTEIRSLPLDVIEECFELEAYDSRTRVFELKDRASVIVAEWVETQPASASEFDTMRESFAKSLAERRTRVALSDWLRPETIRARSQFELVNN